MSQERPSGDVARTTLGVLSIGILIGASIAVLQPFLGALVWATMIVVASWPAFLGLQRKLGGRRWAAIAILTTAMLLLLVVPLVVAINAIVSHADGIVEWTKSLAKDGIPQPPAWVADLPLVGRKLAAEWKTLAETPPEQIVEKVTPLVSGVLTWFAEQAGNVGLMLLHFVLTVVLSAVLYANGETAAVGVRRFARRLAGDRGDESVILAGQAIRAVALGVVGTAVAQTAIAGIGLAVCGIPYASVLTAVCLILCIAQIGPLVILVPSIIWLYWRGDTGWGTTLVVFTVVAGAMDNVLRPILIRRGADLPMLLILGGVIGGLFAFGIIGLFVGPVVLAVAYRLVGRWVAEIDHPPELQEAPATPAPASGAQAGATAPAASAPPAAGAPPANPSA
jgi:predicted PurR-regulated permease PerM